MVTVNSGNKNYKSSGNVIYSKDGKQLVCYPAGLSGNFTIPDSVTEIRPYAFAGCIGLTEITLGKNITSVGEDAFLGTNLSTIYGYAGTYAETYAEENGYYFVPVTSTVTLDCNDEEGNIYTFTVNTGCPIGDLYIPGQEGYIFAGWYIEDDADDILVTSDFIVNEDITLYAYWEDVPEEEVHITGISMNTLPSKTTYFVGDSLNTDGMIITAEYSDGTTEDILSGFYCIPAKLNTSGEQEITVTYSGVTTVFSVTVNEIVPTSIRITTLPDTMNYFVDELIKTKGLVATVDYNNGTTRIIKDTSLLEYIYDFSSAASVSDVNVKYSEKNVSVSTKYQVTVRNRPNVYSETISANAGEEFALPVYISGNTGIMGYTITITYDPNVLTPVDIPQTRIGGSIGSDLGNGEDGTLKVIWYNTSEYSADGLLFTQLFKVNSKANAGEYPVTISYSEDDTFNENFENVLFDCSDTVITVVSSEAKPLVYSDNVSGQSGAYVDIPIYIENNVGIEDASYLSLSFDTSVFEYSECIDGLGSVSKVSGQTTGKLKIRIDAVPESVQDGVLLTVRLKASDNALGNYEIPMSIDDDRWTTENVKLSISKNSVKPTISSEEITASVGDTVVIPVSIKDNSGLMGYKISVSYNADQLTFVDASCADDWSDGNFVFNDKAGIISVVWTGAENNNSNGLLFNLSFKINDDVEPGIAVLNVICDESNTFNDEYSDVEINCESIVVDFRTVTYTFDANGGSVSPENVSLKIGASYVLPTPSKVGYKCIGWNTKPDGTGDLYLVGDECSVEKDMTLYAIWEECRLIVKFNDRKNYEFTPVLRLGYGDVAAKILYDVKIDGATFEGWHIGSPNGEVIDSNYFITTDLDLYARYEINGQEASIIRLYNGGFSDKYIPVVTGSKLLNELPVPRKSDFSGGGASHFGDDSYCYTFVGWHIGSPTGELVDENYIVTSDLTLYPEFKGKNYIITLHPDAHDIGKTTITTEYGQSTTLPIPKKEGYIFEGWYSYSDGDSFFMPVMMQGGGSYPSPAYKIDEESIRYICVDFDAFARWRPEQPLIAKTASTIIDNENKFVYGVDAGLNTINDYVYTAEGYDIAGCCSSFSTDLRTFANVHNYTISEFSGNLGYGTETRINVLDGNKIIDTYTVVIFGDVNGDGWYDGMDAIIVSCLANGMLTKDDVTEAQYFAADCNHDGIIDDADVQLLEQAGVLLASIDQSKSEEELLETSSAYVEYMNLIEQSVETETAEIADETPVEESIDPGFLYHFFDVLIAFVKEFIVIIKSSLAVIW